MEINDMINCLIEIKKLIRNEGRTNIITRAELDEILTRHEINLKELENMKE